MKRLIITLCLASLGTALLAQTPAVPNRVIVGEKREPNKDARLEIANPSGSQAGLLLPFVELTATDKPAPLTAGGTTHAHLKGMTVYNTATVGTGATAVTPGIYYNDGTRWIRVGEVAPELLNKHSWSLTGNAGTDPTKNFLGTTDDKDLVLKRNNVFAGRLTPHSTYLGVGSHFANGINNTVLGASNLNPNTGANTATNNTVVGSRNLSNVTTGSDNIAVGSFNLKELTTGLGNIAIGATGAALGALTTGTCNIAIGAKTAATLKTGVYNIAIGGEAMDGRTSGNNNIAIGYRAGFNEAADGTSNNIMIGIESNPITLPAEANGTQLGQLGQLNIGTLIQGIGSGLYAEGSNNRKRIGINLNNKNATTTGGVFPTETMDVSGTLRVRTLPANGSTNSINTKTDGTTDVTDLSPKQTFNATRTVVADAQGVLGTVAGLPGGASVWSLTGNAGTNPDNNFLGTTDDQDLILKRGGRVAGRITYTSLENSGPNTTRAGRRSVFLGDLAGGSKTSGYHLASHRNTAVGAQALYAMEDVNHTTALGGEALLKLRTGTHNTAIGTAALQELPKGYRNVAVGTFAISHLNGEGSSDNTAIGHSALLTLKKGMGNVAMGTDALYHLQSGDNNIAIGKKQDVVSHTGNNQMNIGGTIFGKEMTGSVTAPAGSIGIKKANPAATLHVGGNVKIDNVPPATASDLNLSYNPTTKEVTATPKESTTKPFYMLRYIITTGSGDWVENWETHVDARQYTMIITTADFTAKKAGEHTAIGYFTGGYIAPQEVYAKINNATNTWHLNADFKGVSPHSSGDHAWYINVLIINNNLIHNLNEVYGNANQSNGGGAAPNNPIP